MSTNLILIFILLASGKCLGYTLRRDIGNIRYYCNQMCTSCGGKPTLEKDVCVCDFEEDTDKTTACVNRHKSKFDFLGIKYEVSHKIKKRSIYNSNHPYILNKEPQRDVKKDGYKYLINRSYIIPEQFYLRDRLLGTPEGFKYSRIVPRMILSEQMKEDCESADLMRKNPELTQFAANMFRSVTPYPKREEEYFKILMPRSNGNYPEIFNGFLKNTSELRENNTKSTGGDYNDISCDYEDSSEECCSENDCESTENLEGNGFELVISEGFEYDDNAKGEHGWERVVPETDQQNFLSELLIPQLQYV